MVETLMGSAMIHGRELEDPTYLTCMLEQLQSEIGRELVGYLWNQKMPVVVELKQGEERTSDHWDWNYKRLTVKARVNPVQMHSMNLDYHMAQVSEVIHVPHFRYFPKDWVCHKCGCIVDGLHSPRLCDRCGAPRSTRAAMIEAMGG